MQRTRYVASLLALSILAAPPLYAADLVSTLVVPGESTDLTDLNGGADSANVNRLGGFGSDLFYDRANNVYYALVDRGPGGGRIGYSSRVQKISLAVDPVSGAIGNFQVLATIPFIIPAGTTLNGITFNSDTPFNGLRPDLDPLNGSPSVLGRSLDPEGFAVAANGNFYVSDEYGPSIYEFSPAGRFLRAFAPAGNIVPRESNSNPNYAADRSSTPPITSGRQDNRGYEGLAVSPDGSKLYAILQDPLVNEGSNNDGRRSRNVRLVVFATASGEPVLQYVYPLESITDINVRVPNNTFGATAQGRNIGVSSITAISDRELLVLERDNRGQGVDDPTYATPSGSKRLFKISLTGATDVTNVSLANTNSLPAGVNPVTKTLFFDLLAAVATTGPVLPEKFEGVAIGPRLNDGTYALVVATDNDFSVTQSGSGTQFDVCGDFSPGAKATVTSQVPIDAGCPSGQTLLPSFFYSLKTTGSEVQLPPSIASFAPTSGAPGTTVTLSGSGLLGTTTVRFGSANAQIDAVGENQVTISVPAGATTGTIQLVTPAGRAFTSSKFAVTDP